MAPVSPNFRVCVKLINNMATIMSGKLDIAIEFVSSRYHIYSTCSCVKKDKCTIFVYNK